MITELWDWRFCKVAPLILILTCMHVLALLRAVRTNQAKRCDADPRARASTLQYGLLLPIKFTFIFRAKTSFWCIIAHHTPSLSLLSTRVSRAQISHSLFSSSNHTHFDLNPNMQYSSLLLGVSALVATCFAQTWTTCNPMNTVSLILLSLELWSASTRHALSTHGYVVVY
jgi:hypothetical protein